jgi:hypothetical protein
VLALFSGGAGHGHYELAKLFYPYSMLLTRSTHDTVTAPLILLALLQFPCYGAIISLAAWRKLVAFAVGLVIIVVHAIAVQKCFSGVIPNFS